MVDISKIDRSAHYFILMRPVQGFDVDGLSFRYKTLSSRPKWVECEIVEDIHRLDDRYKIDLKSVEPGYGRETLYLEDFMSCLANQQIVKKEPDMECVEESWNEPLTPNVHVTHSAYTLKVRPRKHGTIK